MFRSRERCGGRGGEEVAMDSAIQVRRPWNKGLIVGQKRPLLPRQVWSIRVRLEMSGSARDLALFNLAIDSKLRASDLVRLKIADVCSGALVRDRGVVVQQKTGRPVQFEITEVTRQSVERLLAGQPSDEGGYLFRSRSHGLWGTAGSGRSCSQAGARADENLAPIAGKAPMRSWAGRHEPEGSHGPHTESTLRVP